MFKVKRTINDRYTIVEIGKNHLSSRAMNIGRMYCDLFEEDESRMCTFTFVDKEEAGVLVTALMLDL